MDNVPGNLLNVAEIIESSRIYGPGIRFVIWVQGCSIRCKGCWNGDMHSFEAKHLWTIDDLYNEVISTPGIEGITILGGEPLHQSKALLDLAERITKRDLTIMLYTGFEIHEIEDTHSKELIAISDIVVAGRYIEEERSVFLKWRGSSNQSIIFQNEEYQRHYGRRRDENEIEIRIDELGQMTLLGYPEEEIIKEVFE